MKSVRAFIALTTPPFLQEKLGEISRLLAKDCPGVRWANPENIHLTLKFLGQVEFETLSKIQSVLDELAGRYRPFAIEVGGLGGFPDLRRPSVIWVGVFLGGEKLKSLALDLESNLSRFGFKPEKRKFHPHFTIGRVKKPDFFKVFLPPRFKEADSLGSSKIDVLLLMKSTLTPLGAVYEAISKHRLVGDNV